MLPMLKVGGGIKIQISTWGILILRCQQLSQCHRTRPWPSGGEYSLKLALMLPSLTNGGNGRTQSWGTCSFWRRESLYTTHSPTYIIDIFGSLVEIVKRPSVWGTQYEAAPRLYCVMVPCLPHERLPTPALVDWHMQPDRSPETRTK